MNATEVFWIIVATAVTIVLKWATYRWPGPQDRGDRRRRRRDRFEAAEEEE